MKLASGPLRAEGAVVHAGSRVATAEAKLLDADGQALRARHLDAAVKGGEQRAETPLAA